MTTADIIAVMNAGKIEQAGSPEEIYDRPRSEFVARFIGSSNVVKGRNVDERHIEFAGTAAAMQRRQVAAGGESAVSIRQHDIRMFAAKRRVRPRMCCRHAWCGTSFLAAAATIWSRSPTARSFAW